MRRAPSTTAPTAGLRRALGQPSRVQGASSASVGDARTRAIAHARANWPTGVVCLWVTNRCACPWQARQSLLGTQPWVLTSHRSEWGSPPRHVSYLTSLAAVFECDVLPPHLTLPLATLPINGTFILQSKSFYRTLARCKYNMMLKRKKRGNS